MSAREVIARHLCGRDGQGWSGISTFERAAYRTQAHGIVGVITAAGYVILSPDEVRGIRDLAVWALDEVGCDVQLTPGLDITLKALDARDG